MGLVAMSMSRRLARSKLKIANATDAEQRLLSNVLREVRHVMATGEQLNILVDPYIHGNGVHVCFAYNGAGWTDSIEGTFQRSRKKLR